MKTALFGYMREYFFIDFQRICSPCPQVMISCHKKFITLKGIEFEIPKSTTKLSKGEGVEYTDKIILFANQELNIHIPTPCESGYYCGKNECEICGKI